VFVPARIEDRGLSSGMHALFKAFSRDIPKRPLPS
jgi:hypothetical protein